MKRKLISDDIYKIKNISDSQISPDGAKVAFVKTVIDEINNKYKSSIWITQEDKEPIKITNGRGIDNMPRWSPNGKKICYISDQNGNKQLYLKSNNNENTKQITFLQGDVNFPVWSPDGRKIAFTLRVKVNNEDQSLKPMEINYLKLKSNDCKGFIDKNIKNYIYTIDIESKTLTQVTPDDFHLFEPEWHQINNVSWSPNGEYLVFTSQIQDEYDRDKHPWKADVYIVNSEGGIPKNIKKDVGPASKPIWSADGKSIIFIGHLNKYLRTTILKLCRVPINSGKVEILTESFDRTLEDFTVHDNGFGYSDTYPKLSLDGKTVYFIASDFGSVNLFSLLLETKEVKRVIGGNRRIYGFDLCQSKNKIAISYSTVDNPGDIALFDLNTEKETRLTDINKDFLNSVSLSIPEEISYMSKDDIKQYGWIMKPIGFKEGKKYPCVLEIHGGPYTQYGWTFFFEFQLLAAQGYAVIYCNPRGSRGYGQKLSYDEINNFGKLDYDDIMRFTDEALECGYIDSEKLAVTGGSYGGYMTNWIISHTSRFKVAVTQRCISNWMTMYTMSDTGYFMVNEMLSGKDLENLIDLWEISPLAYAENINTPLLILHSEKDMRCPIEQSEQLYILLKSLDKEVEMVRFPESNHGLSRSGIPSLRLARLNYIVNYIKKHID